MLLSICACLSCSTIESISLLDYFALAARSFFKREGEFCVGGSIALRLALVVLEGAILIDKGSVVNVECRCS